MKRAVKRMITRRHGIKWGVLGGLLASGTYLLRYIPESWPTWAGATLAIIAFIAAGVSSQIAPESGDA